MAFEIQFFDVDHVVSFGPSKMLFLRWEMQFSWWKLTKITKNIVFFNRTYDTGINNSLAVGSGPSG